MKCPACKAQLPNDSEFCQYCGQKIEFITSDKTVVQNDTSLTEKPQVLDTATLVDSTALTNDYFQNSFGRESKRENSETTTQYNSKTQKGKAKHSKKHTRWIITLSILLILAIALNVYQYMITNNQREEINNLEARLSFVQENLSAKQEAYSELQNKYNAMSLNRSNAVKIYDALQYFDYGQEYSDYYAEAETVLVRVGEEKTIKIYCSIRNTTMYMMDTDSFHAIMDTQWSEKWKNNCTEVYITGKSVGTSTITFTNDANNHKFNVLVIVLP